MASSDLINQLAKAPVHTKLLVLGGALAVVGLLYYQLFYSSLEEEKASLEARRASLLDKQRTLNKDLEDQQRLAQQNEELQRSIRDNQRALPTEAELPAFFDHLQRKAGDAGVSIRRWERRDEKVVDIYIRVPVYVEVTGTYYNIMRYFALLGPQHGDTLRLEGAAGRVDERIVSIENLQLGETQLRDGEVVLTAKFVASTFRQQSGEAAAAAQQAGPRRGGQR